VPTSLLAPSAVDHVAYPLAYGAATGQGSMKAQQTPTETYGQNGLALQVAPTRQQRSFCRRFSPLIAPFQKILAASPQR